MKDIRQGSLFEDSHESKRWHCEHIERLFGIPSSFGYTRLVSY